MDDADAVLAFVRALTRRLPGLSDEPSTHVRVHLRVEGDPTAYLGATFTVDAPHEQAVAALADHIQDHVLEYTCGALLPPCPGHRHPLQTDVVDGIACWVCPKDREHRVEPILPADDAG